MLYYSTVIFLSAFLLFQIQPLMGKYILPWFGGTPAVWSTSMLFYQMLLLAGYGYAHGLVRLSARRQGIIHLSIISLSLGLLMLTTLSWPSPIMAGLNWRPTGAGSPIGHIFIILGVSVGLPYFLLSTNSPLLQAWFSLEYPDRSPYRLYALSNIGSLLALITYHVLLEPILTLRIQGWLWAIGYVVFVLLVGWGALRRTQSAPTVEQTLDQSYVRPVRPWELILWVALAATASIMLLAITNQITQEVAVIPFLWILPLTLYLLSFILTFSAERWYWRSFYGLVLAVTSGGLLWVSSMGVYQNILVQIVGYSVLLFGCCMICHGELVRLKPHPRHLTLFYLMVSVGGVSGGIFVNLIAPFIFKGFWELHLAILLCWLLLFIMSLVRPPSWPRKFRIAMSVSVLVATIVVGNFQVVYIWSLTNDLLASSRNFYGILRVRSTEPEPDTLAYQLSHGATIHGFQYRDAARRHLPNSYYTEKSGVGLAILNHPKLNHGMRIGVLGLGVGTLAAYGQAGDSIRFYEINPNVIELAEGQGKFFSYLSDCACQVTTILGDARLSLEHELAIGQPQKFDVLALDTFSSDSIPTHLLTQEAFAIYVQHLQPDGVLAVHVTNRHLNLLPVVRQLADNAGLAGVVVENGGDNKRSYGSTWVLLSHDVDFLKKPTIAGHSYQLSSIEANVGLWTDDYSNLYQILK